MKHVSQSLSNGFSTSKETSSSGESSCRITAIILERGFCGAAIPPAEDAQARVKVAIAATASRIAMCSMGKKHSVSISVSLVRL